MNKNLFSKQLATILSFLFIGVSVLWAQDDDLRMIINLKGIWKFSIGNKEEWKQPKFNDSDWELIKVPSPWEDQGFEGYNGYGFYRKTIRIDKSNTGQMLYLKLGYIDDVDETYFNGVKIGKTGSLPPHTQTAYLADRKYYIPEKLINYNGNNVITVKVYDYFQFGGIISGDIGIYATPAIKVDINLQGMWKFHTGDNRKWKEPAFNDTGWSSIFAPSIWENQGYRDYDGFAWYRKTFVYTSDISDNNLVLLLGKIDDLDQAYINGVLVGSTNLSPINKDLSITGNEYQIYRGYSFLKKLLKKNQRNTIAVRVYDKSQLGGIYAGPLAILTQAEFKKFQMKIKK